MPRDAVNLVGTDDGRYELTADFDRLHEIARELAHHHWLIQLTELPTPFSMHDATGETAEFLDEICLGFVRIHA